MRLQGSWVLDERATRELRLMLKSYSAKRTRLISVAVETLCEFHCWAIHRALLGAREKSPAARAAAGLARPGYFLCSRLTSRTQFSRSGIAHVCRNQSNVTTLRQIGSITTASSTRATPPSVTPVIILAKLITLSRRVLAASSAAILLRCQSGRTGSQVSQASVEAVRRLMFRRFGFSLDAASAYFLCQPIRYDPHIAREGHLKKTSIEMSNE